MVHVYEVDDAWAEAHEQELDHVYGELLTLLGAAGDDSEVATIVDDDEAVTAVKATYGVLDVIEDEDVLTFMAVMAVLGTPFPLTVTTVERQGLAAVSDTGEVVVRKTQRRWFFDGAVLRALSADQARAVSLVDPFDGGSVPPVDGVEFADAWVVVDFAPFHH